LKTYQLREYLDISLSESLIKQVQLSNINPDDVQMIITEVNSLTINANSHFSLLDQFENTSLTNEQLSIIASGLEKVILETSFTGLSRYYYTVMPLWAEKGANVRILKVNHFDFTFFNNEEYTYEVLISENSESSLEFTLIGYPFISSYEIQVDDDTLIPYEIDIIDDDTLDALTEGVSIYETDTEIIYSLVVQVGVNGNQVIYHRTTQMLDGSSSTVYLFSENRLPVVEIIHQNIVSKGE